MFELSVKGVPVQQGSKKAIPVRRKGAAGKMEYTGKTNMIEMAKGLPAWRKAVTDAAIAALPIATEPMDGPLVFSLVFWMPRPKSHPKTTMTFPVSTPDLDKLVRAVGDSMTAAGVWTDDSRVVDLHAHERYALPDTLPVLREMMPQAAKEPGMSLLIRSLTERDW